MQLLSMKSIKVHAEHMERFPYVRKRRKYIRSRRCQRKMAKARRTMLPSLPIYGMRHAAPLPPRLLAASRSRRLTTAAPSWLWLTGLLCYAPLPNLFTSIPKLLLPQPLSWKAIGRHQTRYLRPWAHPISQAAPSPFSSRTPTQPTWGYIACRPDPYSHGAVTSATAQDIALPPGGTSRPQLDSKQ